MHQELLPIIVVSGLPRSGTSLMMQMLQAGGVSILTDNARAADESNPRGYFELDAVKRIKADHAWLDNAHGKAVKIIHLLLKDLPVDRDYRVIFMRRDLDEVITSQSTMLARSGKQAAAIAPEALKHVYQAQLKQAEAWIASSGRIRSIDIEHARVLASPQEQAERIAAFLGGDLDIRAMAAAVDPSLHRERLGGSA